MHPFWHPVLQQTSTGTARTDRPVERPEEYSHDSQAGGRLGCPCAGSCWPALRTWDRRPAPWPPPAGPWAGCRGPTHASGTPAAGGCPPRQSQCAASAAVLWAQGLLPVHCLTLRCAAREAVTTCALGRTAAACVPPAPAGRLRRPHSHLTSAACELACSDALTHVHCSLCGRCAHRLVHWSCSSRAARVKVQP